MTAAAAEYLPEPQFVQADAPAAAWKVPAAHGGQADNPAVGAKVPARQVVQVVDATAATAEEDLPARHKAQAEALADGW